MAEHAHNNLCTTSMLAFQLRCALISVTVGLQLSEVEYSRFSAQQAECLAPQAHKSKLQACGLPGP